MNILRQCLNRHMWTITRPQQHDSKIFPWGPLQYGCAVYQINPNCFKRKLVFTKGKCQKVCVQMHTLHTRFPRPCSIADDPYSHFKVEQILNFGFQSALKMIWLYYFSMSLEERNWIDFLVYWSHLATSTYFIDVLNWQSHLAKKSSLNWVVSWSWLCN